MSYSSTPRILAMSFCLWIWKRSSIEHKENRQKIQFAKTKSAVTLFLKYSCFIFCDHFSQVNYASFLIALNVTNQNAIILKGVICVKHQISYFHNMNFMIICTLRYIIFGYHTGNTRVRYFPNIIFGLICLCIISSNFLGFYF